MKTTRTKKPIYLTIIIVLLIIGAFLFFNLQQPNYKFQRIELTPNELDLNMQKDYDPSDAVAISKHAISIVSPNEKEHYATVLPFITARVLASNEEISELQLTLDFYIQTENMTEKEVWAVVRDFYFEDIRWQINLEDQDSISIQNPSDLAIPYDARESKIEAPRFFSPTSQASEYRKIENLTDTVIRDQNFKEVPERDALYIEDNALQITYPAKVYPYIYINTVDLVGAEAVFRTKINYKNNSQSSDFPLTIFAQVSLSGDSTNHSETLVFEPLIVD